MPSTSLTILKGQQTELTFRLTVPIGCYVRSDGKYHCELTIHMFAPDGLADSCKGEITAKAHFCKHLIRNNNWNANHSITLGYRDTGKYTSKYNNYVLNLKVMASQSGIWNNHKLPSIKVLFLIVNESFTTLWKISRNKRYQRDSHSFAC